MPSLRVESAELSSGDVALARIELYLLLDRPGEAARLLADLPGATADAETARGLYALATRDTAAALKHLRRAIDLGSRDATPYFEYALLLRDARAPAADVRKYLAEAAGRNPKLAEAQFLIGVAEQEQDRHREAIDAFQSAIGVLPRQSYFWHAMAVSLRALDRVPEAARAARKAMDTARTNHEFDMASTLARSLAAHAPAAVAPKPAVTVPGSWSMPMGDARAEGSLEHIDCLGRSARFHIRTASGVLRLMVDNPGDVLIRTESALTFTFSCGAQKPRKVTVVYRSAGTITALEFH
jgi:tetratricopeptide (TPR) repeat protein